MTQRSRDSRPLLRLTAAVGSLLLLGVPSGWTDDGVPDELGLLADWMTGTFSSAVQAADDPQFFDVTLHMTPIWLDRDDGPWLYVEQAMAEYPDRPYRQRVYQLRRVDRDLFESRVFTLPDPPAVIGAWRAETPLDALAPGDLERREGCSILMRRRGDAFVGSTLARLCTSTLQDATYATSEVLITAEGMVSWDRGFDADGNQVWGSTEGGYVFDRIMDDTESESEAATDAEPDAGTDAEPEVGSATLSADVPLVALFGSGLLSLRPGRPHHNGAGTERCNGWQSPSPDSQHGKLAPVRTMLELA
jgi:hypothetical protein